MKNNLHNANPANAAETLWRVCWETRSNASFVAVGSSLVTARTRIGAIRYWRSRGYHVAGYKHYDVIRTKSIEHAAESR